MTAPLRPAYVFPDVETLLVNYLEPLVGTVRTTVPADNRPARFVVVRRVGGVTRGEVVDVASVAVEAWDLAGRPAAYGLAALVRAHVAALPGKVLAGTAIYNVGEGSGPAFLPDPDSTHARYTFLATIGIRGASL